MKPIIFGTDDVRAILEGRKSQTRRVMKPQPTMDTDGMWHWKDCQWMDSGLGFPKSGIEDYAPYKVGDVLWVRETWCEVPYEYEHIKIPGGHITIPKIAYKASSEIDYTGIWCPSIHMPREAARIFLRVKSVRAERVQEITIDDAIAEAALPDYHGMRSEAVNAFRDLWDVYNAKRGHGWDANPWAWAYEFERIEEIGLEPAAKPAADYIDQDVLLPAT